MLFYFILFYFTKFQPEGNLLRDHFKSFERRNMLTPTARQQMYVDFFPVLCSLWLGSYNFRF